MNNIWLTIFTPTYNRAYMLHKLYESLKNQTRKDFEWLIIDDGSSDDTRNLIKKWINENTNFKIRYYYQNNGGKHRAINKAVKHSLGKYFFIVDSDDYIVDDAIDIIYKWCMSINNCNEFAGVSGLKGYNYFDMVGSFPRGKKYKEYIDATNLERDKYKLLGDKAEVYKTEILAKYPFIEYENENFITESTVWDKMAYDGLKIRWYNRIIYICNYLDDGLTKSGSSKFIDNWNGFSYYIKQELLYNSKNYIKSIKLIGNYSVLSKSRGESLKYSSKVLNKKYFIVIICYLIYKTIKGIRK